MGKTLALASTTARRLAGSCFYCGRHVTAGALACRLHKDLLGNDPLYGPDARVPDSPAWYTRPAASRVLSATGGTEAS